MKPKYIYDINIGHFIKVINEDGEVTNNGDQPQDPNTQNAADTSVNTSYKSVESNEEYQKITADITAENTKYEQDKSTQQQLLDQARKTAASNTTEQNKGIYDPVSTDQNVLNIMKRINDLNKQHYTKITSLEDQKLQVLSKLSTANEGIRFSLPEKYKGLNESNIHTAKIYMGDLVGTDTSKAILKGMADFKRTFKDTNLLYGKDRQGYFLIILDQDDMDVMYNTLDEVGYLRDDIIGTVMPQLLDRSKLIQ